MNNVMLDIETMGTGPNAMIISIGAVKFSKDEVGAIFYSLPTWEGDMDAATVQWWLQQSEEARKAVCPNHTEAPVPLKSSLLNLASFVESANVWGNGSDFDNVIVLNAYKRLGLTGWSYRNNRCFRTVKNMFNTSAYTKPEIPHHALYDAIAQVKTLQQLALDFNLPL